MTKKILLVDDDKITRSLIARQISGKGYEVIEVEDGESCIGYLRDNVVDLVLLDILMPGISGIGVLKCIREKHSQIELPVIMVTGVSEEMDTIEAIKSGANDYVNKPVNINVVQARIESQLKLTELHNQSLYLKEIESINTMIITYNHEINNPLFLVQSIVSKEAENNPNLEKALKSIERISLILKKIEDIKNSEITYTKYGDTSKLVNLEKKSS